MKLQTLLTLLLFFRATAAHAATPPSEATEPVVAKTSSGGVELSINGLHGYQFEVFGEAEPLLLLDVSIRNGSRRDAIVNAFWTFELVAKSASGDLTYNWDPYDPADVGRSGTPVRCSDAAYPGGAFSGTTLDHATLAPGESRRGMLVFKVPQICDWRDMRLVYRPYAVVRTNEMTVSLAKFAQAMEAAAAAKAERKRVAAEERAAAARAEEEARRAAALAALDEGDAALARGDHKGAIKAWDSAAKFPETAGAAKARQAGAWVAVAAALAPTDTNGALKALEAAAKVAPSVQADRIEREAAAVRVTLAGALADSAPADARRVLTASKAAQAADPALYRAVTVAAAATSCDDAALAMYDEAGGLAPLAPAEAESAGECALSLSADDLEAGRLSAARRHLDSALRYAPSLQGAGEVERNIKKAERKAARGSGYDARPLVGRLMLGGGAVMLVPAFLGYGEAGAAQEEIQSGPHAGSEVESLAAEGQAAETRAWLWSGGAVVVAAGGYGVLVWHAVAQHADAGSHDMRVAVIPGPTTTVTFAMEW